MFALSVSSLAYLDGGSGSLLIQVLVGGVLTAGYVVKTQWNYLKAKISRSHGARQTR